MNKLFKHFWYMYIYWPIYNFFVYRSPVYISTINIFKIYKDWWKARKCFQIPYLKFYKMHVDENLLGSDYFYIETSTYNKWLYFNVESCGYKLKFGEFRFENVPYICLIWRNKTKWIIGLEAPLYDYLNYSNTYSRNNLLYWEAILTYNYEYNKDIIKTFENNIWSRTYILKDVDDTGNNKKINEYNTIISCLKNNVAEKIINYYLMKYEKSKENN